jgi:hypothetical protein
MRASPQGAVLFWPIGTAPLVQNTAQMPARIELSTVTLDAFGEGELLDLDDRTAHILRMRSGMVDGQRYALWEIGEDSTSNRREFGSFRTRG